MVEKVPVKNNDIIWRNVGGETVLLNSQNGKYFGLNAVGCSFWEKIDGSLSLGQIVELLQKEYEVERAVLEQDILQLVAGLQDNGLVSLK